MSSLLILFQFIHLSSQIKVLEYVLTKISYSPQFPSISFQSRLAHIFSSSIIFLYFALIHYFIFISKSSFSSSFSDPSLLYMIFNLNISFKWGNKPIMELSLASYAKHGRAISVCFGIWVIIVLFTFMPLLFQ